MPPKGSPAWSSVSTALTFCGTRGFFPTYNAQPDEPILQSTAAEWPNRFLGEQAPAVVPEDGPLTWGRATDWWSQMGRSVAVNSPPDLPLSRAEFCSLLYALEPLP